MNHNDYILSALSTAMRFHHNQVDQAGELYILHPIRVFQSVRDDGGDINQQVAAILHDVVEDTNASFEYLAEWFSPAVVILVRALTRPQGMDYEAYLDQVIAQPHAIMVKEADLADNLDRIRPLREMGKIETADRLEAKYRRGMQRLWDTRDTLWKEPTACKTT